jgi:hypothetical protein
MHKNLIDELEGQTGHKGFRAEFLNSYFCRTTRLLDILENPEGSWAALQTARGLGRISLSRLRQLVANKFANQFPEDWREAQRALSKDAEPDSPRARKLARFITVWDAPREAFEVSGRYMADYEASIMRNVEAGEKILVAHSTLPLMLKTPDVTWAETRDVLSEADHQAQLQRYRENDRPVPPGSLAAIDKAGLDNLVTGAGVYATLSPEQRSHQFAVLLAHRAFYPNLDVMVVDYRSIHLSPGLLLGGDYLLIPCCGGYIELHAPDLTQIFTDRMEAARKTGEHFRDWLDRHRDHPVIAAVL